MKIPRSRILIAFAGMPLAVGLATSGTIAAPDNTIWVAVAGPADPGFPSRAYELQVGKNAWPVLAGGGGGVAAASFTSSVTVRLLDAADCSKVVSFTAAPATRWVIRFRAGSEIPAVEDWTGQGMDTGPALEEDPTPACALPDTSTTTFGVSDLRAGPPLIPIGLLLLALAGALQLRAPKQGRSRG